jgi:lysophospholipase L1-like esterase
MKTVAKMLAVWAAIFFGGVICFEIGLRYLSPLPVHGGVFRDHDGNIVRIAQDEFILRPNLEVVHSSSEFRAEVHTDELGFRKTFNESRTPDYLFLGDSFTFGHGVADEEVFSSIFCHRNNFTCLNLGRSGTDTFDQVRILRHAIDTLHIKPKNVAVVMLASCSLDVSGNDIGDNLSHYRHEAGNIRADIKARVAVADMGLDVGALIKRIQLSVGDFEITKRVMLLLASKLKRGLYTCSDDPSIEAALKATDVALAELETLAKETAFRVGIFVIHPYQELDGAFRTTQENLRKLPARRLDWYFTGQYFRREHYYPYDGHFNSAGHANMASVVENALLAESSSSHQ